MFSRACAFDGRNPKHVPRVLRFNIQVPFCVDAQMFAGRDGCSYVIVQERFALSLEIRRLRPPSRPSKLCYKEQLEIELRSSICLSSLLSHKISWSEVIDTSISWKQSGSMFCKQQVVFTIRKFGCQIVVSDCQLPKELETSCGDCDGVGMFQYERLVSVSSTSLNRSWIG